MGKNTGFMEIPRQTSQEVPPLERIEHFQEFHVPLHPDEQQAQELEKLLNTLGSEGWELVQKADGFYFFKREKSDLSE